MKRAIIYARVSYSKRREEKVSIQAQIEQSCSLADRLEAQAEKIFVDDGKSAWHGNRPAFEDAMDYCDAFDIDYFITWSTSRFSRNRIRAALDKERLERAGVSVKYVSSPIDRATDEGWLLDGIYELFDEHQSRGISRDTKRSMIRNAKEGYWNGGHTPFGYAATPDPENPKKKRLVIDDNEAPIVRRIFELRQQGHGGISIARILNKDGISNRGRQWNKVTLLNLLSNDTLRGNIVFNKRDRKNKKKTRPREEWIMVKSHKAIVDDSTWNRVQALLGAANPTGGRLASRGQRLFSGLIYCGVCGAAMRVASAHGTGGQYYYYQCSSVAERRDHAPNRIRADKVDRWLSQEICEKVFTRETITQIVNDLREVVGNWARDQEQRRRLIIGQLQSAERASGKIYELFELHGKKTPNLHDLTRRLRKHRGTIDSCEAHLEKLDAERPPRFDPDDAFVGDLVEFLQGKITSGEVPEKTRAFFSTFIEKVEIHASHVMLRYNPERLVSEQNSNESVLTKARWPASVIQLSTRRLSLEIPESVRRRAA